MAEFSTVPTVPPSFTGSDLDRGRLAAAALAVTRHENFAPALALFCRNVVAAFEAAPVANQLMGQAGRFAMLAVIIALDAEYRAGRDAVGATVTRLAQLLGRRRLASPGRVHAMAAFLRQARMIEAAGRGADHRHRRLRPTALMIDQAARWVESSLSPCRMVDEIPAPVHDLVARPDFVAQFFVHMVAPFVREGFILYDDFPEVERLMQRTGGYVLMIDMLRTAVRTPGGAFVADIPPEAVAARMSISRAQVRSLLALAESEGWLTRGRRVAELDAGFAATLQRWVATELAWGADLARRAARSCAGD